MSEESDYRAQRWSKHFEEIDLEIARHALACQVALLDHGVIERVLRNETGVCGKHNEHAFTNLRSLLMMHYSVRDQALVALGEEETLKIIGDTIERLRSRIGHQLGGPTG